MIDTSALLAALIVDHGHDDAVRPYLTGGLRIPAIVLAETYSQLRRTFGQPAETSARLRTMWWETPERVLATTSEAVAAVSGGCRCRGSSDTLRHMGTSQLIGANGHPGRTRRPVAPVGAANPEVKPTCDHAR